MRVLPAVRAGAASEHRNNNMNTSHPSRAPRAAPAGPPPPAPAPKTAKSLSCRGRIRPSRPRQTGSLRGRGAGRRAAGAEVHVPPRLPHTGLKYSPPMGMSCQASRQQQHLALCRVKWHLQRPQRRPVVQPSQRTAQADGGLQHAHHGAARGGEVLRFTRVEWEREVAQAARQADVGEPECSQARRPPSP